jgi:hypothetical protein
MAVVSYYFFDDKSSRIRELALAQFKLHGKALRLRFVHFSLRLNCSKAPLLAPRVRGCALLLTRHASSRLSVPVEQERAQAVCHQKIKAASAQR